MRPDAERLLDGLGAALADLGFELDVQRAPADPLEAVRQAIDSGTPAAAFGWGGQPQRWSVICGYDRRQGLLCGRLPDQDKGPALGAPPELGTLLIARSRAAPLPLAAALVRTVERLPADASDELSAWAEAIAQRDDWEEGQIAATEAAALDLLEARTCAARLTRRCAEPEDGIPGAWMLAAAELLEELVELLDRRRPHFLDAGYFACYEDRSWRQRWADDLQDAVELQRRACACLRLAPTAAYPPDIETESDLD